MVNEKQKRPSVISISRRNLILALYKVSHKKMFEMTDELEIINA